MIYCSCNDYKLQRGSYEEKIKLIAIIVVIIAIVRLVSLSSIERIFCRY